MYTGSTAQTAPGNSGVKPHECEIARFRGR